MDLSYFGQIALLTKKLLFFCFFLLGKEQKFKNRKKHFNWLLPNLAGTMKKQILLFFLLAFQCGAQNIFEINQKLGRGVNMGNMFEAPSESEWGNPFRDDYFQRIADLGFDHVRIPIRWDVPDRASQTAPYTINPQFLERITYVVKKAQDAGLMAIINMHHHETLFENPTSAKARFLSQWQQISKAFKDHDENLLFEVLNEPHGEISPSLWNQFFAEALATIRVENPTRAVLLGTAQFGGLGGLPLLEVPNDPNIILTIHYYEPFNFTHQGAEWVANSDPWLGTKWKNSDRDQNAIKSQFSFAIDFAKKNNIPINIGEFGAYNKADNESRILWTTFLARWFEEQAFSWSYWEFSAGFGFYSPATGVYKQDLVDALLKNPLPEPVETRSEPIYESDFANNNSGWTLGVFEPAQANFTRENGTAKVTVSTASATSWHVQFVLNNVTLINGKTYLVTFDGYADRNMALTSYVGQSVDPYGSYSGYPGINLGTSTKSFEYVFTMNAPSDSKARLVFDMANGTGTAYFSNIKVSVLLDGSESTPLSENQTEVRVKVFPNPVNNDISFENIEDFEAISIWDTNGILKKQFKTALISNNKITIKDLSPGVYFIRLVGEKNTYVKKIVFY